MDREYPYELKRRVRALVSTLERAVTKDSEQELHSIAAATVEAVLREGRIEVVDDPVVSRILDVATSMAEVGGGLRAIDDLLVARQIDAAHGPLERLLTTQGISPLLRVCTLSDMAYTRGAMSSVRAHVLGRPEGEPFAIAEVEHLGSRTAVDQAISRLTKQGVLARVTRGVYVRPRVSPLVGIVPPAPEDVVAAIGRVRGHKVGVHGAEAARQFGLTTQVPVSPTYLTTGRSRVLRLGRLTVRLRHASERRMALAGRPAGTALTALTYLGSSQVSPANFKRVGGALPESEARVLARSASVPKWIRNGVRPFLPQPAASLG